MSLTHRSHQVNSRTLIIPCFSVLVDVGTWRQMSNVHLSYKPNSSRRILFWYGGHPRKFSCLKKFRALVVPSGGYHEGIIIQGMQMSSVLLVIGQSSLRRKGDATGASIHATRQRYSTYVHKVGRYIYKTIRPEQPNSPIHQYERHPQKSPFITGL